MAVNPTLAKLNAQALKKAVSKSEKMNKPLDQGKSFKDLLNNMQSADNFAQKLGVFDNKLDPQGNMKSLAANDVSFQPQSTVSGVDGPEVSRKVVDMLSEVNKGQMQMDSMVNQILYSDKKFNNQELLAVQAHVYHYAQMAELTVKIAEHGIASVKQVLNTQVQ
jgi:hypothetical protein